MNLPFRIFESHLRLEHDLLGDQNLVWPGSPTNFFAFNPRLTVCHEAEDEDWYFDGNPSSMEEIQTLMDPPQQPSISASGTIRTASDIWSVGSSVSTALTSVVLKSITDEDLPNCSLMTPGTQIFVSSLHRQILFSLANNFAGLGAFPIGDLMLFSQRDSDEKLYQLVRSARGYTSRAIIQNIFKAAIELGDARIVDLLVRENPADIRVNKQFLLVGGIRYTPIERATALRHESVVKSLLSHGADVNRTQNHVNNGDFLHGALDYTVHSILKGRVVCDLDFPLFQILLEAGGDLSQYQMLSLIRHGEGQAVELIVYKYAHKNAAI